MLHYIGIKLKIIFQFSKFNFVYHRNFTASPQKIIFKKTFLDGPISNELMEVPLTVIDEEKCKGAYSKIKTSVIDERVLCAGDYKIKKDSCKV